MNNSTRLASFVSPLVFLNFTVFFLSVPPIVQIIWVLKSASLDSKVSPWWPIRMLERESDCCGCAFQVHSNAKCKWGVHKLVGRIAMVGKMGNPPLMRQQLYDVPFCNNETFEVCCLRSVVCFELQLYCYHSCLLLRPSLSISLLLLVMDFFAACFYIRVSRTKATLQIYCKICLKKNIVKIVIY